MAFRLARILHQREMAAPDVGLQNTCRLTSGKGNMQRNETSTLEQSMQVPGYAAQPMTAHKIRSDKPGILPDRRSETLRSIIRIMSNHVFNIELVRAEIAAAAARMIAEDGADYATAKKKAAKQVLGNARTRGEIMPDNMQIEDEVRKYNELFFGDTQPARLLHLRKLALRVMEELIQFSPYLTGAVLHGTAGEHSDIYLQLFPESAKDVEIFLLNKNVDFEVSESAHFKGHADPVETVSFMWQNEGVHLALYESDDLRGALKTGPDGRQNRANVDAVRTLIMETEEK